MFPQVETWQTTNGDLALVTARRRHRGDAARANRDLNDFMAREPLPIAPR
jgi:hypothetical protein